MKHDTNLKMDHFPYLHFCQMYFKYNFENFNFYYYFNDNFPDILT